MIRAHRGHSEDDPDVAVAGVPANLLGGRQAADLGVNEIVDAQAVDLVIATVVDGPLAVVYGGFRARRSGVGYVALSDSDRFFEHRRPGGSDGGPDHAVCEGGLVEFVDTASGRGVPGGQAQLPGEQFADTVVDACQCAAGDDKKAPTVEICNLEDEAFVAEISHARIVTKGGLDDRIACR